jgi:Inhibitor of growth proteins N-terminal histone-binding
MPSANTNDHESLFESFMESLIPQLPNEIRRNLDHIRVLDLTCTKDLIALQRLQKEFIKQSEYKILKLKVCTINQCNSQTTIVGRQVDSKENDEDSNPNIKNNIDDNKDSSQKKRSLSNNDENHDDDQLNEKRVKTAGVKVTKHWNDMELGIKAPTTVVTEEMKHSSSSNYHAKNDDSLLSNDINEKRKEYVDHNEAFVPTTEELMDYILMDDPADSDDDDDYDVHDHDKKNTTESKPYFLYQEILRLQTNCIQKSEEKVTVAKQTHQLLKSYLERLEIDVATMEKILQVRINKTLVFWELSTFPSLDGFTLAQL